MCFDCMPMRFVPAIGVHYALHLIPGGRGNRLVGGAISCAHMELFMVGNYLWQAVSISPPTIPLILSRIIPCGRNLSHPCSHSNTTRWLS